MIGAALSLLGLSLMGGGCSQEERCYTDSARPEWSYDKPFYVRPAEAEKALNEFGCETPEVYTQRLLLEIPRPEAGDIHKAPRMAVWMTKDYGIHWDRIGYFGLQQRYFPYEVDGDGVYGIRFIGPGIPPAQCKPPRPHIIYHVDTKSPCVSVFVSPDQEYYLPGQRISVNWSVNDVNLEADSVSVSICISKGTEKPKWTLLGEGYASDGCLEFDIPDEAIDKTITVRVMAWDKAKNPGQGYSCPISVVYEVSEMEPCTQPADTCETIEVIETSDGEKVLTTMPTSYPSLEE
jgi:hypothetical protein